MRKNNILDALFPRTRQNILATLLLSPERRWYLSDLAQRLGVPPSSLQRELASLTAAGILSRAADGNRVYYQANPSFPLLPELQSLFAKTSGLTDQIQDALTPFGDEIDLAFIFGSVARGERTAQSDVDVLVVGSVGMADLALPLRELERMLQIPVNVTHFRPSEFRDKLAQNNHFLQTILRGQKIFLKGSDHELANVIGKSKNQSTRHEQAGVG
jgi:predicted nucleotidyltransferase